MENHLLHKHRIRDVNLPNQSNIFSLFKEFKTDNIVGVPVCLLLNFT